MSIAQVLLQKQLMPAFPHSDNNHSFASYSGEHIINYDLSNFRQYKSTNLHVFAGGPDKGESETDDYIKDLFKKVDFTLIRDKNSNKKYEIGIDEFVGNVHVVLSDNGAYLLEQHKKLQPETDAFWLFVETGDNDLFSSRRMLIKSGSDIQKYSNRILKNKNLNDVYSLTADEVNKLVSSLNKGSGNVFVTAVSFLADGLKSVINWLLQQMADYSDEFSNYIFNTFRIGEHIWNPEDENYVFGDFFSITKDTIVNHRTTLISMFESYLSYVPDVLGSYIKLAIDYLNKGVDFFLNHAIVMLQANVSLICGFWNGLVDLIGGIFSLISMIIKGIFAIDNYSENKDYYNAVAEEQLDDMFQSLIKIDWTNIVDQIFEGIQSIGNYFKELNISESLRNSYLNIVENFSYVSFNYSLGYFAFQVLEFIFPPLKLAKIDKLAKVLPNGRVTDKIVKQISKNSNGGILHKLSDDVNSSNVLDGLTSFIQDLIQALKNNGEGLIKSIKSIFDDIIEFFESIFSRRVKKRALLEKRIWAKRGKRATKNKIDKIKKAVPGEVDTTDFDEYITTLEKYKTTAKDALDAYIMRVKRLHINTRIGQLCEEVIFASKSFNRHLYQKKKSFLFGKKPNQLIRIPDAIEVSKKKPPRLSIFEVKSGGVKPGDLDQLGLDIRILKEYPKLEGIEIDAIVWHVRGEINEASAIAIDKLMESLPKNVRFEIFYY